MKNLRHFIRLNEEEGATSSEEVKPEEGKSEEEDVDSEDAGNEETFVEMFSDTDFISAFKNSIQQYTKEKVLDDKNNEFNILPYIDFIYKDDTFGISIEFDSSVSINIEEESGKVVDSEIPDIKTIKFKTPTMDNLTELENPIAVDTVSIFVKEALEEIKEVAR